MKLYKKNVKDENVRFEDDMSFGDFLREKRLLRGMCQIEFSEVLGFNSNTICHWENGHSSPPIETAREIIKALGGELKIVNKPKEVSNGSPEIDQT